jgi:uncharacterized protein
LSPLTRRRFLQGAVVLAAASTLALAEDGVIREPNHPRLVRVELPLARWPAALDGFTIAQLSDFHYDEYFSAAPLRAAIEIVNRLHPDLVVLTGDFVTVPVLGGFRHVKKRAAWVIDPCAGLLAQLNARLGMFAVLGNHDVDSDAPRIVATLQSHGITVLHNASLPIEQAGARFWLSGLDSAMEGKPNLDLALRQVPQNEPVVLLVHEPDFADRAVLHSVDLQLSGHSHGGQIWLPGIGAPWLPEFARKYPRGLYTIGPLTLYTNFGLGTIRLPVRLNCPPEVTLFTLRAANQPTES